MKSRITVFASLTLIMLLLTLFVPASLAQSNGPLTKKELKVLLKSAKQPAEHRRIAEYYRQEAQRLTASSKHHAAEAEVYAKNPPFAALESKHGYAFGQSASHCRFWSKLNAEEAAEAIKLAALHDEMAQKAELQSASLVSPSTAVR